MSFDWAGAGITAKGVTERRFDVVRAARRIPGVVWMPERTPKAPALVLLGHGGTAHKRQDYIVALARRLVRHHGFAAAAIDGPVHGDRRDDNETNVGTVEADFARMWHEDPTMTDEMVTDWRAVLDALQSPTVLGSAPVGWWGLSMGTILGLPVVAAEPRISVAVLGLMGIAGPTKTRLAHDAALVRCPVLFLVQWDDELFPKDRAFEMFSELSSPDKRLHANPGRHTEVPDEEFRASEHFLARTLAAHADHPHAVPMVDRGTSSTMLQGPRSRPTQRP
jgi:pimeloyl-ACP methyl ester carboxylesterase